MFTLYRDVQGHSKTFKDVQQRSGMFRDVQGRSGTFRDVKGRSRTLNIKNLCSGVFTVQGCSRNVPKLIQGRSGAFFKLFQFPERP
jgi:hypothetical protein